MRDNTSNENYSSRRQLWRRGAAGCTRLLDSTVALFVSAPLPTVSVPPRCRVTMKNPQREHLYKILVIGELGTGKTSIIKRYVHQFFSHHYRATTTNLRRKWTAVGDTRHRCHLVLVFSREIPEKVSCQSQERFGNMTRVYYKEAVGAFIVFDVTRSQTFEAVRKWKADLDSKVQLPEGSSIPCVLLANKCDMSKEGIVNDPASMDQFCKDNNFAGWFLTSAKENVNIEDAARFLISQILHNHKALNLDESGQASVPLSGSTPHGQSVPRRTCC
ncbi:hypothetical protein HPB50_015209 [Hyalomma asiaticum]|uniref:Uncharacterized protein n=1 Tax=Hyalomma asiaticum TaxID=266040 RepID=A0ACB7SUE0_HYAAI|nr:hypothetical protein HPB50_015209 [Hyalomma asiaticum]